MKFFKAMGTMFDCNRVSIQGDCHLARFHISSRFKLVHLFYLFFFYSNVTIPRIVEG